MAVIAAALACVAGGRSWLARSRRPIARSRRRSGRRRRCKLPPVEKRTLSNGLPVWIMGVHKVPTVQLELAVTAGIAADPAGQVRPRQPDRRHARRRRRHAQRARDRRRGRFPRRGAVRRPAPPTPSYVDLHVPVARLADALPIMADVVARPTFPEAELKRLREERLASLLETEDDPEQLIAGRVPARRLRRAAPLRHRDDGHRGVAQGDHRRRT